MIKFRDTEICIAISPFVEHVEKKNFYYTIRVIVTDWVYIELDQFNQ